MPCRLPRWGLAHEVRRKESGRGRSPLQIPCNLIFAPLGHAVIPVFVQIILHAETFFHRRRYLPDITSHNATVRNFAERNAINAPIQGSAADIIKIAMVRIYERFRREGIRSKMILQVHDELNFSVLPEEKELVEKIVIEEMQNAYPLQVPLVADSGWGENWLEAH